MTWKSPDEETFNQIDHFLIDSRHMSDVLDVRTYRGACFDSDHFLVKAKLRARLSNARKLDGKRSKRFDCKSFKNEATKLKFQTHLSNTLNDKNIEMIENIEDKWSMFSKVVIESGKDVIGSVKKQVGKDWFDSECLTVTQKKNTVYQKMLSRKHSRRSVEEYKAARKEEKRVHRKKKRIFHEDLLRDVEHLKGSNESRAFYREINLGRRDFKPRTALCRNKNGEIISDKMKILERWNEHFQDLLNMDHPQSVEHSLRSSNQDLIAPPSLEEIAEGIKKLKNHKAPGPDTIPSELLKNSGIDGLKMIHHIILSVWNSETLPQEWKLSTVCPIHKKGDILECSNYRGISLLCTSYKVFSNILFNRLSFYAENIIGDYQCGFRRGRSTTEQIFNLRQILQKTREFQISTYHLFIDFKTAYDCINRKRLIEALNEFDIPDKLVKLISLTLTDTKMRVKIQGDLSEPVDIENGVRQGDALACLLFNIALEKIIRDSKINTRSTIFSKSVQIIAYADDIDIIARTQKDLKDAFLALEREAQKMHLSINQSKTKYMQCLTNSDSSTHLEIGDYSFEKVNSFIYLGSEVNIENNLTSEIRRRSIAANRCFYGLRRFLKSNEIKRDTKLLLYRCLIRPVLTYASETWTMTQTEEKTLALFERKILRSIFGGLLENGVWRRKTNSELYHLYKEPDIIKFIKIQRMKWAGHVLRMEEGRTTKRIFQARPTGSRKRGRPKLRWEDCLENDFRALNVRQWRTVAPRRRAWRDLLEKAKVHPGLSSH